MAASFDCRDAKQEIEQSICSNEKLNLLDENMANYYFKLKETLENAQAKELLTEQRAWLKSRGKSCSPRDYSCLTGLYKTRILQLRKKYENLVPYSALDMRTIQETRHICSFGNTDFPEDMSIYAGGSYSGKKISHQIDQSGHQATQFEVLVNSPDEPVALILGAYEPSIWNIAWTQGTQIKAVLASGYHRQVVAGLPNDTPILNSSYDNRGPCGYLYIAEKNLKKINPLSNRVFGKNVNLVHYANNGNLVFGNPIASDEKLFTSADNPPESFIDKSKPLAGPAGLEDLTTKGFLRRATSSDHDRWAKLKANAYNKELPPVANGSSTEAFKPKSIHNGYVILRDVTIPAGLYGGNSATLFLNEGVPYPKGQLGHSTLYDFNTLTCRGVACGR